MEKKLTIELQDAIPELLVNNIVLSSQVKVLMGAMEGMILASQGEIKAMQFNDLISVQIKDEISKELDKFFIKHGISENDRESWIHIMKLATS